MLDSSHFYLIRKRWMATNNLCSTDPFFHGLLWWSWCVVNDFGKTNMVNMSRKKANGERDTLLTVPEKLRTLNMKFVSTPLIEQNSCVMTYSISHFFVPSTQQNISGAPCALYLRFSSQSRPIFYISYLICHRDIRSWRTMVHFLISIT